MNKVCLYICGKRHNSLLAEPDSSSYSWYDYSGGGFLEDKFRCVSFHNFGAFVYFHISKDSRKKLEPTKEL